MVLERRAVDLVASSQFRVPKRQYTLQYAQLYYQRLTTLRPAVLAEAARRWGAQTRHVGKVLDVPVGERCFVVGTVYVDMPEKPNILDEVSSEVRSTQARRQRQQERGRSGLTEGCMAWAGVHAGANSGTRCTSRSGPST